MTMTNQMLLRNCLISSIAHAIMSNVYPELAYEQSWDNNNYSFQDGSGLRGTFTFRPYYCIGAIRNDSLKTICGELSIRKMINTFPADVINTAFSETLRYLLIDDNGTVVPEITSIFWCNNRRIFYEEVSVGYVKQDFEQLPMFFIDEYQVIESWVDYYDMNSDSIDLLKLLLEKKMKNFNQRITLDILQRQLIPGGKIHKECKISLEELHIYFG